MDELVPETGHPVANEACAGRADASGVWLDGARIDALVVAGGVILRTSDPDAVRFGVAQVRRALISDPLDVLHVVFAPRVPRPLLLGLVLLRNRLDAPLLVNYSELWAVPGGPVGSAPGVCLRDASGGRRALADAATAIRARAPEPPPESGLALDVRLAIPPGEERRLAFAYAAPEPGDDPAPLVAAWRGDVERELASSVATWLDAACSDPLADYRARFAI